jgi:hypothetical protein
MNAAKTTAKKKAVTESKADRKEKKMTQAVEIYQKLLPKKEKLSKRDFRALVVEEFRKKLGLENSGTIGMYFSIADKRVTGRDFKSYNRVAERKPNRTPEEKAAARADRERQRAERKAQREQLKLARKAVTTGKHPKGGVAGADAIKALADEAFEKIQKISNKAQHEAEVIRANAPAETTKAARKRPATKKAAAKKAPVASRKSTTKKASAKKTA